MNIRSLFVLAVTVAGLGLGCSAPKGATCDADADCGDLSCLAFDCSEAAVQSCKETCEADTDCGEGESCVETCTAGVSACVARQTEDLPFSSSCEADDECAAGLSCLEANLPSGAACNESTLCTIACTDDADCADLGGICLGCAEGEDKVCVSSGN